MRVLRLAAAHARLSADLAYRDGPFWLQQLLVTQAASRSKLSSKQSDEAWKEGSAMDLESAVAYALEEHLQPTRDTGPLTRREVEVSRLVATGLTNRQIAGK